MASTTGNTGDGSAASDDSVVTLSIPKALQEKYPELIGLIRQSESMNNKERQYWINIIPVMTEPQTNNLLQILRTEKKELAAIDEKYANQVEAITTKEKVRQQQIKKEKKRRVRVEDEAKHHEEASDQAEDILDQIESL
jgi:cellulose biosynthesis protein BcsQ